MIIRRNAVQIEDNRHVPIIIWWKGGGGGEISNWPVGVVAALYEGRLLAGYPVEADGTHPAIHRRRPVTAAQSQPGEAKLTSPRVTQAVDGEADALLVLRVSGIEDGGAIGHGVCKRGGRGGCGERWRRRRSSRARKQLGDDGSSCGGT
jgi:hypothetical protein